MELHSYARKSKIRSFCKQWTVEDIRQLVDARIRNDELFFKRPSSCLDTWRKIALDAELANYDVVSVRKQWTNMLIMYKKFKQSHLGNVSSNFIDEDIVQKISKEWEFFYPIHKFMSRKVTNLHSYANTQKRINQNDVLAAELESMLETNSSPDCDQLVQEEGPVNMVDDINDYNIDDNIPEEEKHKNKTNCENRNEEALAVKCAVNERNKRSLSRIHSRETTECEAKAKMRKSSSKESLIPNNRELINSLDTPSTSTGIDQSKLNIEKPIMDTKVPAISSESNHQRAKIPKIELSFESKREKREKRTIKKRARVKTCGSLSSIERDKYYRHKRRFNRRLEHRIDSLLGIFGQIIKTEYPNIDVGGLIPEGQSDTSESEAFQVDTDLNEESNTSSTDE